MNLDVVPGWPDLPYLWLVYHAPAEMPDFSFVHSGIYEGSGG
jgi:hypothetical protein